MDLGSAICVPRNPRCLLCPLRPHCAAYQAGDQEAFPVKAKKAAKPQRYGTIFWAQAGHEVLLVRRPGEGLLGGMRALPTGPWADAPPGLADAPVAADWTLLERTVAHGFTHFDLQLALATARVERHQAGGAAIWWPVESLGDAGLPTVFAKAARAIGGI
jgi:A/G-specific adenine glycosylase